MASRQGIFSDYVLSSIQLRVVLYQRSICCARPWITSPGADLKGANFLFNYNNNIPRYYIFRSAQIVDIAYKLTNHMNN